MPKEVAKPNMDSALERRRQEKQLVVALDFGTTSVYLSNLVFRLTDLRHRFSGIFWRVLRTDQTEPIVVRGWPTPLGSPRGKERDESKVPTRLLLNNKGEVKGWGYEVTDGDGIALDLFKLAIVPDDRLPGYLRDSPKLKQTKKQMQDLGLSPTQVIEMYIQKIWAHARNKIMKGVGAELFKSMRIHVVITVPAIWSHTDIERMESAAATSILQAQPNGSTTFEFLSEPEAAVQTYHKDLRPRLGKNGIVLVVDLGGGTVDLIPYMNGGEGDQDWREAAPGSGKHFTLSSHNSQMTTDLVTGGLCGAALVDEAFENLVLSKLPEAYENIKAESPGDWTTILSEQWEHRIKRDFYWDGSGRKWTFKLSNVAPQNDITLHENEIRRVFEDSVMRSIIGMIKEQIVKIKKACNGRGPTCMLPVGGFGRCPYIIQRLEEEFQGTDHTKKVGRRRSSKRQMPDSERIEVRTEEGNPPWTAVGRGACHHGIRTQLGKPLLNGRCARFNWGFTQNVHGTVEQGAVWMPEYGSYMIRGEMVWIVRQVCFLFFIALYLTHCS